MTHCTTRTVASFACVMLGIAALGACNRKGATSNRDSGVASRSESSADTNVIADDDQHEAPDPCTFLSASEAAKYVGTLATPPYRASEVHPSTSGDACEYRGRDGRVLEIKGGTGGGAAVSDAVESVRQHLGAASAQIPGIDTLTNRVLAPVASESWDKATWIPGGSLFVTKGDVMVVVDVTGASGKQSEAIEIAKLIVPRIGHPLDYDGAKAVALVPKPPAHPDNPCEFLSRAEVEKAIGTLAADPVADANASQCTYRIESANGTREYPVAYTWEGGARGMNLMKHGTSAFDGVMKTPGSSMLDTMTPTGQMGDLIGGLMKVAGGGSMHTAAGAASTTGLRTDTTLVGPWNQAMLWHGTMLMAERNDAMATISLKSADYEHAKALLTTIANKL